MRRHTDSRTGFTLIELLVVISIIGLLVGMSSSRSSISMERSRDAAVMLQLTNIRTAIHQYALDNGGRFPESLEALSPKYLPKAVSSWRGSRASGVIAYDPVSGGIRLAGDQGMNPENTPDSRGRPYAEY